ncbi:PE_PGRS family protein [Granulicella sibirica]|uniref:PE_PGRS family protein n=2 Tax=Granulicella sibirica TaxID=2479048 RepID=A0A4Q0T1G0_9BACT|nr:PE_PGRS family protein [Granulicella sibirica]
MFPDLTSRQTNPASREGEDGFALVMLIVAIFVILLFLGIAAPKVARDLRRERELEAVHRGNQYVRAVQLYYKKFNSYPTSIDQLEKTNNIRFLRQKYVDPMTGKADWRIIHVGENKTTVKGLFGQPLTGLAGGAGIGGAGIGGTATVSDGTGSSTSGPGSSTSGSTSTFGSGNSGASSTFGSGSSIGGATSGSTSVGGTGSSAFGGPSTVSDGSSTGSTSSGSSSGIGSQSATGFKGSGGPIMGFGSSQAGASIISLNEQDDYSKWEFLYDPRIEQLKARSSLFGGGGIGSSNAIGGSGTGTSSFGSSPAGTFGASPGTTGSGTGAGSTTMNPTSPTGTTTPQ